MPDDEAQEAEQKYWAGHSQRSKDRMATLDKLAEAYPDFDGIKEFNWRTDPLYFAARDVKAKRAANA